MPADNELERLINEYGNTLLRMCYLFLKDYQLAEDAVQETFIKVMKSYETFKHKSSEKTWITRIAINVCKNEMRGGWFRIRKNNDFDEDTIGEKTFEDAVVDRDSLSRAIMRLNDVDREIIILYYYQELHIKEIAPIMHISENTALQRLRRARGKLKKILWRTDMNVKERIDKELNMIYMDENLKKRIRSSCSKKKSYKLLTSIAASLAIIVLAGGTAFAGYYALSRITVNEEETPELSQMYAVDAESINGNIDEYGMSDKDYSDYESIKREIGIPLLDTELSQNNPYMRGHIMTDNKDFAIITVDNYVLGDTSNYIYNSEEERYFYNSGEEYTSSVSLSIDIMLSKEQEVNGWTVDYLGMYKFVESYISDQGYKVNILEDQTDENVRDYVSEKCAVFVKDGIRYTLKGRIPLESMKEIINSLKY